MQPARFQSENRFYIKVTKQELCNMPMPARVTDMQDMEDTLLVEYPRTNEHRLELLLCGVPTTTLAAPISKILHTARRNQQQRRT